MMYITRTDDYLTVKEILSVPVLFNCTYGQGQNSLDLWDLKQKEWLLVLEDHFIIGCIEIREVTKQCLEVHIYVLPEFWSKSKEFVATGYAWAKEQGYKSIFSSVPENCIHMLRFVHKVGFEAVGSIKNGIVYNGHLVTLFLFNKQLGDTQ